MDYIIYKSFFLPNHSRDLLVSPWHRWGGAFFQILYGLLSHRLSNIFHERDLKSLATEGPICSLKVNNVFKEVNKWCSLPCLKIKCDRPLITKKQWGQFVENLTEISYFCSMRQLAWACGVRAVGVRAVDCWQWPPLPFWGPLAAILDFAAGAAFQVVSECPLRR